MVRLVGRLVCAGSVCVAFYFSFMESFFSGVGHACHRDRGAGWADLPASAGRQLIDLHTGDFLRVTRVGRHKGKSPLPF